MIEQRYRNHRTSFYSALMAAQKKYAGDINAGLGSGSELLCELSTALQKEGSVRLFKYQKFTERNLQDCVAGVLHLSKLDKLNDINEGRLAFDTGVVSHEVSSLDIEQLRKMNPALIQHQFGQQLDENTIDDVVRWFNDAKGSGELDAIAQNVAIGLRNLSTDRRDNYLCGSLSTTECSASMWDRYAYLHRGFVAGYTLETFSVDYTTTRMGTCSLGFKALVAPVFYGERFDHTFNASIAAVRDPSIIGASNVELLDLTLSLLQKAAEWEHEQEWRVIAYTCNPHSESYYCRLKPDSVYIGMKMQADEKKRLIEVAHSQGWRVFEMQRSTTSLDWTLKVDELPE